jgi:glycosyltransferase involved in cell wall biosynthesis
LPIDSQRVFSDAQLFRFYVFSSGDFPGLVGDSGINRSRRIAQTMPKINLLYVITKLELGGAQKQTLSLINQLDKNRYNVFLFTAKNGLLIPQAQSIAGLNLVKSKFLERPINPVKDGLALIELYFFIKKNAIQIIHTHSSKAGILGRLAGALAKTPRIIHTAHGWSFNDYQSAVIRYLYVWLERFCANFTSKIIVVSAFDRKQGLKRSIGRPDQYSLIRYGLEIDGFKDLEKGSQARKFLGISDGALVVGMVACFKPQKAPLDFIELAARVSKNFPGTKFVLVGDGKLRRKIELRIRQLNLETEVILTGWRQDIPLLMRGFNIFVLTSLWEGLPIVVLEAMACAVALVATDTGGIREVVADGQGGYLVKPHDISSMQNRLEELLGSAQKRGEFADYSSRVISQHDFLSNRVNQNTEQLYLNLMQERVNA